MIWMTKKKKTKTKTHPKTKEFGLEEWEKKAFGVEGRASVQH